MLSWHIPIFLPTNSLPESSPFVQCFIALNCEIFLCDFSAACRSFGSKFIHQGEKNAAKYADEVIVLSKGVQDYFKETYGRETHFIPNGVNRPQIREASLITDKFGLKKDSYILFLGRLVPEKGIRYLVEALKNVKTDKKLVIAGGSSDTDSFIEELKDLAKGDDRILFGQVYIRCSIGVLFRGDSIWCWLLPLALSSTVVTAAENH